MLLCPSPPPPYFHQLQNREEKKEKESMRISEDNLLLVSIYFHYNIQVSPLKPLLIFLPDGLNHPIVRNLGNMRNTHKSLGYLFRKAVSSNNYPEKAALSNSPVLPCFTENSK